MTRISELGRHVGPWVAIVGIGIAYWVVYSVVKRVGDRWTQRRGKKDP